MIELLRVLKAGVIASIAIFLGAMLIFLGLFLGQVSPLLEMHYVGFSLTASGILLIGATVIGAITHLATKKFGTKKE